MDLGQPQEIVTIPEPQPVQLPQPQPAVPDKEPALP